MTLTWAAISGCLRFYVDGVEVDSLSGVRLGILLGDVASAYRHTHTEPQGGGTDEETN
jgi:hypothetical protein